MGPDSLGMDQVFSKVLVACSSICYLEAITSTDLQDFASWVTSSAIVITLVGAYSYSNCRPD